MSQPNSTSSCPDCSDASPFSRRKFLKTTAVGAAAAVAASAGIISVGATPRIVSAADASAASSAGASETLAATLFKSLSEGQRKLICFPFDHALRLKVDNNWKIVKNTIGEVLSRDQRQMVHDIFLSMHSDEYAGRVLHQVDDDNASDGGFDACAVALFGEPASSGNEKFEFVFTGRHVTRRCDGNSVEGEAFGGPIFYGHAAETDNESPNHRGNIYWYQALQANQVFESLDGKQRKLALRDDPRPEQKTATVKLRGSSQGLAGIPLSELSSDQKGLVRKVMADLLAPFRQTDSQKALQLIEAGGFDNLHMAFYNAKGNDIGNDGVWDVWQLEGPSMVWYFRGAPHVHTWVHVRDPHAPVEG
jgi:hypothetical protein